MTLWMTYKKDCDNGSFSGSYSDWLRGYDSDPSATPNQAALKLAKFAANLLAKPMDGRVVGEELYSELLDLTIHMRSLRGKRTYESLRAAPHAQAETGGWIAVTAKTPEDVPFECVYFDRIAKESTPLLSYGIKHRGKWYVFDGNNAWDINDYQDVWGVNHPEFVRALPAPPQPEKGES